MPDFFQLLSKPAGQSKKPKVLVPGNYSAIVKSHEIVAAPQGKDYTAIIRFHLGLLDWPETAGDDDKQDDSSGTMKAIDLSKRQMRRDFYDNAMYRLDEFIRSCGVEANDRSYQEVLPELTGARVVAEVTQYLNNTTNEIGAQIGRLTGAQ